MKRLAMVLFILVVCSALASAKGIAVSGGLLSGNTSFGDDELSFSSSGVGFYVGGEANVGPIAITGSYGGFSSDKVSARLDGEEVDSIKIDTDTAAMSLLAGLKLPVLPFAVGGGWVSQQWTWRDSYGPSAVDAAATSDLVYKASGLALGAFGNMDFAGLVVLGKFYFVPAGTISFEVGPNKEEEEASGIGGEIAAAMQFTDTLGVEAGYRCSNFTFKDPEAEGLSYKASGLYAGARITF